MTSDTAGRLIAVSNRLPVRVRKTESEAWEVSPADGGLVTALTPVLKRRGGIWAGWPGISGSGTDALRTELEETSASLSFNLVPVFLSKSEVRYYYRGFANEIIWPLFHDWLSCCNFDLRYWAAYRKANMKFAKAVAAVIEQNDIIWVHDYHLMDAARELRKLGVMNTIVFFNHIPFPSPDTFFKLPWRRAIMDSLLQFDLLGFQLARDEQHFLECVRYQRETEEPTRHSQQTVGEKRLPVTGHFPISIDFSEFAEQATDKRVEARVGSFRAQYGDRQIILGVDRLDYSKGLLAKFAGFRRALEKHPQLRARISLVQYVVPSRLDVPEYKNLRLEIERTVGEINGAFSEPGWIPVHYFFQNLPRDELCAQYRASDICLVTSLKDGMNLIAKEYCAAQIEERGVLILSEFTGAATELGSDALCINPFDTEHVADNILCAFEMDAGERAARMRRLRDHIRRHDVHHWVDNYLSSLLFQTSLPMITTGAAG